MRIAACFDLPPRKLGSLEQWILAFAEGCVARGHQLHLFWHPPVHPQIEAGLDRLGVGWTALEQLESEPWRWSRTLRRSYDLLYLNLVVPRSRTAAAAFLAWPAPVLYFDQISGPMPGDRRPSRAGRAIDPFLFARVRAVAGCSAYVTERDQRRFRIDPARCSIIYNGVDIERFAPGSPRHQNGEPVLLAVAYLIPEKGMSVLIDACAQIADLSWRLRIVGDGPEAARLREQAAIEGIGARVEFPGLRDNVEEYLRSADLFVHPAIWEEAFGLTITEAMACECPTIASRIGGVPEIIEDGLSGRLFPAGDAGGLAAVLRELLSDAPRRLALGRAGRQRVLEFFTLDASVRGQLDWIEQQMRRS